MKRLDKEMTSDSAYLIFLISAGLDLHVNEWRALCFLWRRTKKAQNEHDLSRTRRTRR